MGRSCVITFWAWLSRINREYENANRSTLSEFWFHLRTDISINPTSVNKSITRDFFYHWMDSCTPFLTIRHALNVSTNAGTFKPSTVCYALHKSEFAICGELARNYQNNSRQTRYTMKKPVILQDFPGWTRPFAFTLFMFRWVMSAILCSAHGATNM